MRFMQAPISLILFKLSAFVTSMASLHDCNVELSTPELSGLSNQSDLLEVVLGEWVSTTCSAYVGSSTPYNSSDGSAYVGSSTPYNSSDSSAYVGSPDLNTASNGSAYQGILTWAFLLAYDLSVWTVDSSGQTGTVAAAWLQPSHEIVTKTEVDRCGNVYLQSELSIQVDHMLDGASLVCLSHRVSAHLVWLQVLNKSDPFRVDSPTFHVIYKPTKPLIHAASEIDENGVEILSATCSASVGTDGTLTWFWIWDWGSPDGLAMWKINSSCHVTTYLEGFADAKITAESSNTPKGPQITSILKLPDDGKSNIYLNCYSYDAKFRDAISDPNTDGLAMSLKLIRNLSLPNVNFPWEKSGLRNKTDGTGTENYSSLQSPEESRPKSLTSPPSLLGAGLVIIVGITFGVLHYDSCRKEKAMRAERDALPDSPVALDVSTDPNATFTLTTKADRYFTESSDSV